MFRWRTVVILLALELAYCITHVYMCIISVYKHFVSLISITLVFMAKIRSVFIYSHKHTTWTYPFPHFSRYLHSFSVFPYRHFYNVRKWTCENSWSSCLQIICDAFSQGWCCNLKLNTIINGKCSFWFGKIYFPKFDSEEDLRRIILLHCNW